MVTAITTVYLSWYLKLVTWGQEAHKGLLFMYRVVHNNSYSYFEFNSYNKVSSDHLIIDIYGFICH